MCVCVDLRPMVYKRKGNQSLECQPIRPAQILDVQIYLDLDTLVSFT